MIVTTTTNHNIVTGERVHFAGNIFWAKPLDNRRVELYENSSLTVVADSIEFLDYVSSTAALDRITPLDRAPDIVTYPRSGFTQDGRGQLTLSSSFTVSYTTPGTYTYDVPEGVFLIALNGCGGGGGGGSGDGGANNDGPGYGGGGSNLIQQNYEVVPGQTLYIVVGTGGTAAFGDNGGAGFPTMVSSVGIGFFASGGGGGGSHPGWGPVGEVSPAYFNIITGESVAAVNDTSNRGGAGANGANNGGYPTAGSSTNGGANGGTGGPYDRRAGTPGQAGKLFIIINPPVS